MKGKLALAEASPQPPLYFDSKKEYSLPGSDKVTLKSVCNEVSILKVQGKICLLSQSIVCPELWSTPHAANIQHIMSDYVDRTVNDIAHIDLEERLPESWSYPKTEIYN